MAAIMVCAMFTAPAFAEGEDAIKTSDSGFYYIEATDSQHHSGPVTKREA